MTMVEEIKNMKYHLISFTVRLSKGHIKYTLIAKERWIDVC